MSPYLVSAVFPIVNVLFIIPKLDFFGKVCYNISIVRFLHVLDTHSSYNLPTERKNMSSLTSDVYYQKAQTIRPRYRYECADFTGSMLISGLSFPENPVFGLPDKIWSSVRKRIEERYGVYVTCLFVMDPEDEVISGNLLLNCAVCEDDPAVRKQYNEKFKETFNQWTPIFEEAIDAFLLDPDHGYAAYCQYVESCDEGQIDPAVCNEILNKFLFSVNLKTEKDEKKKRRIKEANIRPSKRKKQ